MSKNWQRLCSVAFFCCIVLGAACQPQAPEPENQTTDGKPGEFTLTAEQQQAIGLSTTPVISQTVNSIIESFGRVIPHQQGRVQMTSPIAGHVTPESGERIPSPGMAVRKGQILAEVEQTYTAPEQVQLDVGEEGAGGAAQEAKAALDTAAAEYQRSQNLLRAKIVSRKRVEEAKGAWLQAQSRYETATRQAASYRIATASGGGHLRRFALTAPIAGVVVQADVTAGQQVDTVTPLFVIADLSTVWVEAPVFEGDLENVDAKTAVTIHSVGTESRSWIGQPLSTGAVVDPLKRTTSLLYEVKNTDGVLRLGMSVTITLPTGPPQTVVMTPEASLIEREGRRGIVYVRRSPTTFAEQEVTLGVRRDGFVAIVGGVQIGDDVVVTGVLELFGTQPGRLVAEE